jgi:hypothetical protein
MSELKDELNSLSSFLEPKIQVPITIKGKVLIIDSREETFSTRNVKTYVKRFLYHRGLSENYRVTEEHDVIRITKRKLRSIKKAKKEGTKPSVYDTLPYFFPVHP